MSEPYIYNWQTGKEDFYKWLIIGLVADLDNGERFERLSEATDKWQRVEIGITLNGEAMPVERFINSLEERMKRSVADSVKESLDAAPRFDKLYELLDDVEHEVTETIRRRLAQEGIKIDNPYDDY